MQFNASNGTLHYAGLVFVNAKCEQFFLLTISLFIELTIYVFIVYANSMLAMWALGSTATRSSTDTSIALGWISAKELSKMLQWMADTPSSYQIYLVKIRRNPLWSVQCLIHFVMLRDSRPDADGQDPSHSWYLLHSRCASRGKCVVIMCAKMSLSWYITGG